MRPRASRASNKAIVLIDDAGAGTDGIGGMRLWAVTFGERRGNAGLRPDARAALAEGRDRDHGYRQRRKLERREQAGEPCADNDHAAL